MRSHTAPSETAACTAGNTHTLPARLLHSRRHTPWPATGVQMGCQAVADLADTPPPPPPCPWGAGDGVHVLTGPIYVCGAEKGDFLQVRPPSPSDPPPLSAVAVPGGAALHP